MLVVRRVFSVDLSCPVSGKQGAKRLIDQSSVADASSCATSVG
jgi:hypothetical protein